MLDRYLAALPAMSLIPFAPFFTADFLAPFFALLFESPAVCSAIRYGPMSSFLPLFLYSLVNQVERVG